MAAPKIRTLRVDEIKVDDRYQRIIRPTHVAKIVAGFNPDALGLLKVNNRSGVFYCFDGGHRLAALTELGVETVRCEVFDGLTAQEEAAIFYTDNLNRLKVNSYERFVALRFNGDEHALEIDRLVRKYGWKVSDTYGPNNVHALHAVERVANRYGLQGLDETFSFIKTTWNGSDRATEGWMIRGVAHFISNIDAAKIDVEDVSRKLAAASSAQPAYILGDAHYKNKMQGGGVATNVARKILDEYNKGRKTKIRVAF